MPAPTNWIIPEPVSPLAAAAVARANGLRHPLVAQILMRRGLVDDTLAAYLHPDLAALHAPSELGNVEAASRILDEALRSGRRIMVYGDYDGDGVTGSTLLVSYLQAKGGDADFFIPFRHEGYGITKRSLDRIVTPAKNRIASLRTALEKELAADADWAAHVVADDAIQRQIALETERAASWKRPEILLSVDCGASSRAEVAYAQTLGMEVLVTDHHRPSPGKETEGIVVNPHRTGDGYPNKQLAGVGVAWKLIAAHHGKLPVVNLDLVGLGTITDVMSLTGENRAIVRAGLERMSHTKRPGLAALLAASRVPEVPCPHGFGGTCRAVTSEQIAFSVGPKINAIGRMGLDPRLAVELLLTKDETRAGELAKLLTDTNEERKSLTNKLVDDAIAAVDPSAPVIVYQADLFKGVAGLVAGRLASEFGKPTIVVDLEGSGSARSIEGLDLLEVLVRDYSHLAVAAGHAYAMGISHVEDVAALRSAIEAHDWPEGLGGRNLAIDAVCTLRDLDFPLTDALRRLEPTGQGNPPALLAVSGARVVRTRSLGAVLCPACGAARPKGAAACPSCGGDVAALEGRHLRLTITDGTGVVRSAIWFGHAADAPAEGSLVDIAGRPSLNTNPADGTTSVELQVVDLRPTAEPLPLTLAA